MKTRFHLQLHDEDRFPKLLLDIDWTWQPFPQPGENINVRQVQYVVIARAFELIEGEMTCGVLVRKADETLIVAKSVPPTKGGGILFDREPTRSKPS